ncbi:MAG: SRPBCC domain-containing protein [Candidatus Eisenbacteria bacterium]|nr:SRPBCC domain-containing protein [Candidatus Eisenbacteria bacterium]
MPQTAKTIEIDASPSAVWEILTRFEGYAEWNPYYRWAIGVAEKGAGLRLYATPAGLRPFTFRPRVVFIRPEREMRWTGPIRPFGLLHGEQTFRLEPIGSEQTRLTQEMRLRGPLFRFGGKDLVSRIGEGMEAMNRAMRVALEGGIGAGHAGGET